MAFMAHLHTNLSYEYNDGRLNPCEYTATAKVINPTRIEEGDGYARGNVYYFRIIARPGDRGRDLSRAIRDTFSTGGCSHEHDCCGCATTRATVRRVGSREYKVQTRTTFNY